MENIRKVIHGSGLRVVGMALTVVIGFLLMPFLVHHLGDRTYGYWALVGAILGYYGVLDFGVVTAVEWHVAKAIGEEDATAANRALSTSFFVFAALGWRYSAGADRSGRHWHTGSSLFPRMRLSFARSF